MRSAPSVVVDLPGSRRWALALAALGAAAAAGVVTTVLAHLSPRPGTMTAVAPLAAAAVGALASRWGPHDRGRLAWNGAQWLLDDRPGRLSVMIDLGGWMLLRFEPVDGSGRRRWLPVSDGRVPQALGLRAAVYCRPLPDPNLPGRLPE